MRAGAGESAASDGSNWDVERLERSTRALVELSEQLRRENARLKSDLAERDARVEKLDARILEQERRRTDALKRIDDLVARLEWVDAQLARASQKSDGGRAGAPSRKESAGAAPGSRTTAPPA